MSDPTRDSEKRPLPAWLLGLVIAAILFIVGFFVFGALGFGDNPVLQQVAIPVLWLIGGRQGPSDMAARWGDDRG